MHSLGPWTTLYGLYSHQWSCRRQPKGDGALWPNAAGTKSRLKSVPLDDEAALQHPLLCTRLRLELLGRSRGSGRSVGSCLCPAALPDYDYDLSQCCNCCWERF